MKILLDTHTLLWAAENPRKLSTKTQKLLLDEKTTALYSDATAWEIAIKSSLGKIKLPVSLTEFFSVCEQALKLQKLPLRMEHFQKVESLPFHHRDPFDRLLISQCLIEDIHLVSSDRTLDRYKVKRLW